MAAELDFPQLAVDRLQERGVEVVMLEGELDLSSIGGLQEALDAASAPAQPRVCLDLSKLLFIDSSGLATVIRAHVTIAEGGGRLAVVCLPGAVQRTVKTTGLLEMLTVRASRADALDALGA